ncbi:MAG TPA: hypothetical protein VFW87_04635 [Pirellulales bacterium]|nr:hypothetical protein [Pirellulales bacterium]
MRRTLRAVPAKKCRILPPVSAARRELRRGGLWHAVDAAARVKLVAVEQFTRILQAGFPPKYPRENFLACPRECCLTFLKAIAQCDSV